MENKNRLILSLILIFALWFMTSFAGLPIFGVVVSILFLGAGIWSIIEEAIFVKNKKNRDALPLGLLAFYTSLWGLFIGVGGIFTAVFNWVEGGPFQAAGFWIASISLIILPMLGIWTLMKGLNLISSKKNVRLGIVSLIIGALIILPILFWIIGNFLRNIFGWV